MNGKLIGLLGEAIINLAVSAEIGVLGDYPEYTAMQRRVLHHGGLVLDRIEERIEIVRVEDRHHYRRVRDRRPVFTVVSARGRAHLEDVAVLALAIQHIDVTSSSPNEEEAKVADRALLRLEELVAVTAHYTELDIDVTVGGRELDAHPLVGHDVRLADGILGNGDVVQGSSETKVDFRLRDTRVVLEGRRGRRGANRQLHRRPVAVAASDLASAVAER